MTLRRTFVIAEAGVNHNGSLDLAKKLIDVAAETGADAVKFQTFRSELVVGRQAAKADYQKRTTDATELQIDMLRRLELDLTAHRALANHARQLEIAFLSTPFDPESVDFLVKEIGLDVIKIASGEITNAPLLIKIAQTGRRVILSTGMSTLEEVGLALGALAFGYAGWCNPSPESFQKALAEQSAVLEGNVTLLHCTSEYPACYEDINLRAIDTLRTAFGLPVGLSDHSVGITIPIAAVARGATTIEKHFTLDRSLPGPDQSTSLEPAELKNMVKAIRHVEIALGDGSKVPTSAERKNAVITRKCLVASRAIRRGDILSADDLAVKRAGSGISPMHYWKWIGAAAKRDYAQDELLD
jgi:N-acetylneuraminate synthase